MRGSRYHASKEGVQSFTKSISNLGFPSRLAEEVHALVAYSGLVVLTGLVERCECQRQPITVECGRTRHRLL